MLSLGIKAVQAARAGYKANKARKKLSKAQKARAAKIKKANAQNRPKQDYKKKPEVSRKPTTKDKAIIGSAAATSAAATGYAVKKDNARLAEKYKKKEK